VGVSLVLGGWIVDTWNGWYPDGVFPLGLAGWQVAFIAVALPGFLLALLVARLKEPPRGISEGVKEVREPHPFRKCGEDLQAVIPPLTFWNFLRLKVPARVWLMNAVAAVVLLALVFVLSAFTNSLAPLKPSQVYTVWLGLPITSNTAQWGALAFGMYCVWSWAQSLSFRDKPAFTLILKTPTVMALVLAGALFMTLTNGLMAWAPHYAVTTYNESLSTVGLRFGFFAAVAGLTGTALGGWIGDRIRRASPRGRLYVTLVAMTLPWPLVWLTLAQPNLTRFLAAFCVLSVVTTAWLPGMLSTLQDLVLPRMRGLAYAIFTLGMTIIGLGCGPYIAGLISDVTGDLGKGILSLYMATPLIVLVMWFAIRHVDGAERSRLQRAREAGEDIALDVAV
jgi:MFS family permease